MAGLLKSMGLARLGAAMGLTVAVAGFFMYVMGGMGTAPKALLFSGLDPRDSAEIVGKLDALKVPYQVEGDGSTILVPSDQALRLRMQLAGEGLPAGGSVGYEIFDRGDAFSQTSFIQNVNLIRALEGELGRTIRSLSSIANARVHLNIPKRELFADKRPEPTASVVIRSRGAVSSSQVVAIQNLVASAVPSMSAAAVTVIDEKGVMLGGGGGQPGSAAARSDERTAAYEDRLRAQVEDIVTSVVGPGRARVQVSADVDYSRVTRESQTLDPDGQVVISQQTSQTKVNDQDGGRSQGVTVTNSLPGAGDSGGAGGSRSSAEDRTEETINYEVSKTKSIEVQEGGRVKRLSVAVAVDGSYASDAKGERTYAPRATEEMQQIEQLVRSAIGFDEKRGDQLKVVNLRFNQPEIEELTVEEPFLGLVKDDYWRIAQFAGLGTIALLLIFFVMRPLIQALVTPPQLATAPPVAAIAAAAAAPALPGTPAAPHAIAASAAGPNAALPAPQSGVQAMIDIAQVEGQVKESSVRKVGEIVVKHPDEATSIVRQWLHESA